MNDDDALVLTTEEKGDSAGLTISNTTGAVTTSIITAGGTVSGTETGTSGALNLIRTAINDAWFDTEPGKKQIAKFPKRRLMGEEGLDAMILFLCSDASEFVTGTDFVLDDGQTL